MCPEAIDSDAPSWDDVWATKNIDSELAKYKSRASQEWTNEEYKHALENWKDEDIQLDSYKYEPDELTSVDVTPFEPDPVLARYLATHTLTPKEVWAIQLPVAIYYDNKYSTGPDTKIYAVLMKLGPPSNVAKQPRYSSSSVFVTEGKIPPSQNLYEWAMDEKNCPIHLRFRSISFPVTHLITSVAQRPKRVYRSWRALCKLVSDNSKVSDHLDNITENEKYDAARTTHASIRYHTSRRPGNATDVSTRTNASRRPGRTNNTSDSTTNPTGRLERTTTSGYEADCMAQTVGKQTGTRKRKTRR